MATRHATCRPWFTGTAWHRPRRAARGARDEARPPRRPCTAGPVIRRFAADPASAGQRATRGSLAFPFPLWRDHHAAWNTLAWFATLVALADGLNRVGFVKWFADNVAAHMAGFPPLAVMVGLVLVFHLTHYLFASITAHVTALLPVMLAVGATIPGMNMPQFALMLCLTLGIMGILTPYATGPSPVYYGSGYLPSKDYWRLGAVFGLIFIALFLVVTLPWLAIVAG